MQNAKCKMQNCGEDLIKRKESVRQVKKQKSSFGSFLSRKECLTGEVEDGTKLSVYFIFHPFSTYSLTKNPPFN